MRIGFVTCVQLGLSCVEEILSLGGKLELLVTLEDHLAREKSGRVFLDDLAHHHAIPLHKCRNVNDPDTLSAIAEADLDWLFIVGWSQIARERLLKLPSRGVLGMHPTLLPIGRGRAAIPWAILKDLSSTGVTLFQLDEGVDTGPILDQVVVGISPEETAATLYAKVNEAHLALTRSIWPRIITDSVVAVPQDHGQSSVWPARTPSDGEIRTDMTVAEVDRLVRATTRPYPGAFVAEAGHPVTVWAGTSNADRARGPVMRLEVADGTYFATDFEPRSQNQ